MSLFIYGMDLPEHDEVICIHNENGAWVAVTLNASDEDPEFQTKFYDITEVPAPHGDLIDVDEISMIDADADWSSYDDWYTAFSLNTIKCMPAVIDREK